MNGAVEGAWGEHEIDYILFIKATVDLVPNPEEVRTNSTFDCHLHLKFIVRFLSIAFTLLLRFLPFRPPSISPSPPIPPYLSLPPPIPSFLMMSEQLVHS